MKDFSNWHLEELPLSDHQEENATLFASPDESNVSLNSHGTHVIQRLGYTIDIGG